jgi:hypothetical protein
MLFSIYKDIVFVYGYALQICIFVIFNWKLSYLSNFMQMCSKLYTKPDLILESQLHHRAADRYLAVILYRKGILFHLSMLKYWLVKPVLYMQLWGFQIVTPLYRDEPKAWMRSKQ